MRKPISSPYIVEINPINTGQKIKKLCQERGLSRQHVGEVLGGISKKQISNYYSGKYIPKISHLVKLSDILDTSINNLLDIKKKYNSKQIFIHEDNKKVSMMSDNKTYSEFFKKVFSRGIYIQSINKNTNKIVKDGYYWTESRGTVTLPNIDKKIIHNFIRARKGYEHYSGVEFNTDSHYQIDLEQILISFLITETDYLNKKIAELKNLQKTQENK